MKTFQALLRTLNLRRSDHLITLGDYVDRGPDSKGVIDTLMELREAGFTITSLRGNHDEMMLCSVTDTSDYVARAWFGDWSKSFNINDPKALPEKYVNFLESLPLMAVENDYVFVHAGLAFDTPDPIADSQPDHMLWHETGVPDKRRLGGRVVVTGHLIRQIEVIRQSLNTDRIYLDNGAFTGDLPEKGNLVALNLDSKVLILQPWLDRTTGNSFKYIRGVYA